MKVIKAMKKLKFWSRNKRKRKFPITESQSPPPPPPSRPPPPPPQPYYPVHSHYEPLLPSAPPLPPWLEYDLQFQEMLSKSDANSTSPSLDSSTNFSPSETNATTEILCSQEFQANTCYQQYTVSNPIFDEPVIPQLEKLEKDAGAFGCVVGFGAHLLRCVFPCFHIREVVSLSKG
ncbi:hypothetical protein DH2020_044975 [Rehmannia glutinosa]|uniref:Uncharacterized protein n=1 Tax=Rehmannia glutinosa TaxID=99300 RepID=A0ABR0UG46_REHGL